MTSTTWPMGDNRFFAGTYSLWCEHCGEMMKSIFDPSFTEDDRHICEGEDVQKDCEPDYDLLSKDFDE